MLSRGSLWGVRQDKQSAIVRIDILLILRIYSPHQSRTGAHNPLRRYIKLLKHCPGPVYGEYMEIISLLLSVVDMPPILLIYRPRQLGTGAHETTGCYRKLFEHCPGAVNGVYFISLGGFQLKTAAMSSIQRPFSLDNPNYQIRFLCFVANALPKI